MNITVVIDILPPESAIFNPLTLDAQKDEMLSKNLDPKLTLIYSNGKPNSERRNAYQLK